MVNPEKQCQINSPFYFSSQSLLEKTMSLEFSKNRAAELSQAVHKEAEFSHVSERQYMDQILERNRLLILSFNYLNNLTILNRKNESPGGPGLLHQLLGNSVSDSSLMVMLRDSFHVFNEKLQSRFKFVGAIHQNFQDRVQRIEAKGMKDFK